MPQGYFCDGGTGKVDDGSFREFGVGIKRRYSKDFVPAIQAYYEKLEALQEKVTDEYVNGLDELRKEFFAAHPGAKLPDTPDEPS